MHFTQKTNSEKRVELKNKLNKKKILRFPGAYNPLTAKLISEIGFDVFISLVALWLMILVFQI